MTAQKYVEALRKGDYAKAVTLYDFIDKKYSQIKGSDLTNNEREILFIHELYHTDFNENDIPILHFLMEQSEQVSIFKAGSFKNKSDGLKEAASIVCALKEPILIEEPNVDSGEWQKYEEPEKLLENIHKIPTHIENSKDLSALALSISPLSTSIQMVSSNTYNKRQKYADIVSSNEMLEPFKSDIEKQNEFKSLFRNALLQATIDVPFTNTEFKEVVELFTNDSNKLKNDLNTPLKIYEFLLSKINELTHEDANLLKNNIFNFRKMIVDYIKAPIEENRHTINIESNNLVRFSQEAKEKNDKMLIANKLERLKN